MNHPIIALTGRKRSGKTTAAHLIQADPRGHVAFAEPIKKLLLAIDPLIGEHAAQSHRNDMCLAGEVNRTGLALLEEMSDLLRQQRLGPSVRRRLFDRGTDMIAMLDLVTPASPDAIRLSTLATTIDELDQLKDESDPRHREVRRLLQVIGTEIGRRMITDDLWIQLGLSRVDTALEAEIWPMVITDVRFDNEALAAREVGAPVVRINRPDLPDAGDTHPTETGVQGDLVDIEITNDGHSLSALRDQLAQAGLLR